jgi:hypothetical protein
MPEAGAREDCARGFDFSASTPCPMTLMTKLTYAIGDIHGCLNHLHVLRKRCLGGTFRQAV